jgi:hypothetical protein
MFEEVLIAIPSFPLKIIYSLALIYNMNLWFALGVNVAEKRLRWG